MASRQEENAEAAARVAVDKLSDVNKERRHEQVAGLEYQRRDNYQQASESRGPGVLGGILKSVGDTFEQLKGTVTSKTHSTDYSTGTMGKTGHYTDYEADQAMGRAGEDKDYASEKAKDAAIGKADEYVGSAVEKAMDKAKEAKETTMQKAGEYASYASDKTGECKDYAVDQVNKSADTVTETASEYTKYTAEKAKEESGAVASRMSELKESATAAARRARDYFTGNARDLDQKALQGGDINEEKYGETEFKARQKMQELKLNEEGVYDEAKQRAAADWDTAADRGIAAKRNIYGAVGSVKEAIKDKLTYPTDIVQEARASREYGGPKRGEKMVEDIGGPTGPAAMPTVRTSD
ncbi:UNVERIFIED_CONTAM: Late embryogenesis abundant protein ECP63 [Sesamum latifolium]|uniref:Late embryogenesis abundant protein ECP63 n=1 Tax=Sesamum latifolium TaxID=2727402 RepID=A0AAW2XQ63_9LAMI